jgi:hypothetical protein
MERYLSTLREQAAEATRCEEHLVLLFFGHGTPAHGIEARSQPLRCWEVSRRLVPPDGHLLGYHEGIHDIF